MTFLSSKITRTALVLSVVGVPLLATQFPETRVAQLSDAQQEIQFSPPTPPDPGSSSGDRGQGGGRRGCDVIYPGLTALVPAPRPNLPNDRWGLTVSDRPTIWFDVPSGLGAGTLVEWKIRDANGKAIYKTTSRLPKTEPGVVGFSIPATVPLSIATYQWDLAIYCNSTSDTANEASDANFDAPSVRKGRIQRIAIPKSLQQELTSAKTPLERANLYAKYGVWYDALTTLGTQARVSKDKSILNAWSELLKQQKLESKASTRITSCCTP